MITTEEVHAFSMMCKRITSLYAEKQTSVGIGTGDEKLKRTAEKHRRRIAENHYLLSYTMYNINKTENRAIHAKMPP